MRFKILECVAGKIWNKKAPGTLATYWSIFWHRVLRTTLSVISFKARWWKLSIKVRKGQRNRLIGLRFNNIFKTSLNIIKGIFPKKKLTWLIICFTTYCAGSFIGKWVQYHRCSPNISAVRPSCSWRTFHKQKGLTKPQHQGTTGGFHNRWWQTFISERGWCMLGMFVEKSFSDWNHQLTSMAPPSGSGAGAAGATGARARGRRSGKACFRVSRRSLDVTVMMQHIQFGKSFQLIAFQ